MGLEDSLLGKFTHMAGKLKLVFRGLSTGLLRLPKNVVPRLQEPLMGVQGNHRMTLLNKQVNKVSLDFKGVEE